MKDNIKRTIITIIIAIAAFVAGFVIAKGTYISRMEWAFDQIVYWEPTDDGMDLYDIKGNLYKWE